ncbi:MAG: hypothetical protein ACREDR_45305, partial [Blastocatellia bacterium]
QPTSLLPRSFSKGEQARPVEVPVLRPDEIEFMPTDEAIVVGWTKPAKVKLVPYYEDSRMEPWVRESQTEVTLRTRQNAECDRKRQQRPAGEPRRLPKYSFDWSLIPGVKQAILQLDGAGRPMSPEQRGLISAMLGELEMTPDRDRLARQSCFKLFDKFTQADALIFIKKLELLAQQRGIRLKGAAAPGSYGW